MKYSKKLIITIISDKKRQDKNSFKEAWDCWMPDEDINSADFVTAWDDAEEAFRVKTNFKPILEII